MYNPTFQQRSSHDRAPLRHHRDGTDIFEELRREAMSLGRKEGFAFLPGNGGFVGFTKSSGGFDKRLQYRLKIEGRAADDLKHIGGSGLLLQGLAQFVEQAGILDGDDGLVGEIDDQRDLLVGEWANFLAIDDDSADHLVLTKHRYGDVRPRTAEFGRGAGHLFS